MTEEQARQLLKKKGYFVDNLWHVNDVMENYYCNEEIAMEILDDALTNEATFDQIHLAIEISAEDVHKLKPKNK